jgi:cell division initiation protein
VMGRETQPGPEPRDRLTPADVQQKEFRVSFRGYNEREVDEFLDRVTEELQRYEADLMRMRSERASTDPAPAASEAERVLREARERADSIVREAEARAAGIPAASAADARSVVAPYLNREREFLQQLGGLVQEHARTIKTMVEEARRRTDAASAPPPADSDAAGDGEATASEVVVLANDEERVPATPDPSAEEDPPEGARSLRELFWGED